MSYGTKKSAPKDGFYHSKACKPSSVPPKGPLSFIYDCSLLQPLATYPSTSDEQPLIVDIHGLATRKAYCRTTLLPPRWALTPPFHPYPSGKPLKADLRQPSQPLGRLFSVTLLHPLGRRAVNSCGALCCSDFPPPAHSRQR